MILLITPVKMANCLSLPFDWQHKHRIAYNAMPLKTLKSEHVVLASHKYAFP